jgi:hypothetical protein
MRCTYACGSSEHTVSRRQFLAGLAVGAAGFTGMGGLLSADAAKTLKSSQKRILMFFMHGGVSQLETWDPKPGTDTGGPFRAIPTSVPGVHISELLPYTAKHMDKLAIVRSINTAENDHGKGTYLMHTGRKQEPAQDYPVIGSVAAKLLAPQEFPLPGFIHITPRGAGGFDKKDAAFLGPRFGSITLGDGQAPVNMLRPADLAAPSDAQRQELRDMLNKRFAEGRRTADTEAYTYSYDQALQLMARKDLLDLSKENPKDIDRYGTHDLGRHTLLARKLLEAGVTFVKVTHSNYDTHHENFDFHLEQMGEFDRTFASIVEDLHVRGMLASTLIMVVSEFGRTPRINRNYGRDHWGTAWSVAVGGCGIKGGAVVGKTNANGTAVADRQVDHRHLFHTYYKALGLNPKKNLYAGDRPIPLTDPKADVIGELLA